MSLPGSRTPRHRTPRVAWPRKRRLLHPGADVGVVTGGDLGFDEGAEELLGLPSLGLRGHQQLGGQPTHRGHLQPLQALVRSAGSGGGVVAVTTPQRALHRVDPVGVQRPGRYRRQTSTSAPDQPMSDGVHGRRRPGST